MKQDCFGGKADTLYSPAVFDGAVWVSIFSSSFRSCSAAYESFLWLFCGLHWGRFKLNVDCLCNIRLRSVFLHLLGTGCRNRWVREHSCKVMDYVLVAVKKFDRADISIRSALTSPPKWPKLSPHSGLLDNDLTFSPLLLFQHPRDNLDVKYLFFL